MKKEAVEKLFDSLYKLTDIRVILRGTAPQHRLNDKQKEEVSRMVEEVRQNLNDIEEELLE